MKRLANLSDFAGALGPGRTVCLHSAFAEPPALAGLLARNAQHMAGTGLLSFMPAVAPPYLDAGAAGAFKISTFFPGKGLRGALAAGQVTGLAHRLSQVPGLFARGDVKVDVLLLQVAPPNARGFVSLGISVDYMHDALAQRPVVVAQINPRMPATCGDTQLHESGIDWYVESTQGPQPIERFDADAVDASIAAHVAGLVEDGATLQIGIGALPELVLSRLGHLRHLGIHSGIVTDATRPLVEAGVVDGSRKTHLPGKCVTTMGGGTDDFYGFLHRNTAFSFQPLSVTHDPQILGRQSRFTAINSVLQIDLFGTANAERVNGRTIALPGGLKDFAAAAKRSERGASIVALRSVHAGGRVSNIIPHLGGDAPRSLDMADIDFVVTEYGVADLRGRTAAGVADSLVRIANPAFRDELAAAASRLAEIAP